MAAVATARNLTSDPSRRCAQMHRVRGELAAAHEALATKRAMDGGGAAPHLVGVQITWREDRIREGTGMRWMRRRSRPTILTTFARLRMWYWKSAKWSPHAHAWIACRSMRAKHPCC